MSDMPSKPPVPAKVMVLISKDRLKATVRLTPAEEGGRAPDREMLNDALGRFGVVYGIDSEKLDVLVKLPVYGDDISVASGTAPERGKDAAFTYNFTLDKELRPVEREDRTVDYKNLGIVVNVSAGDLLCKKIPAIPGKAGTDVTGRAIPPPPVKNPPISAGKNVTVSPDGLSAFAAISGQPELINGRVTVNPVFTVNQDVSVATGNIKFLGSVVVMGNVLSGFTIEAEGSVAVHGFVEAAVITAKGGITVTDGVNGMGTGVLTSGQNVRSKYLQNCTVQADGLVEAESIINSNVKSGDSIKLNGKAVLFGGKYAARNNISARSIGSRNSTGKTELEVGADPKLLARNTEIPELIREEQVKLQKVSRLYELMSQYEKEGRLDAEKAKLLESSRFSAQKSNEIIQALTNELEVCKEQMQTLGFGKISAKDTIAAGTRITIGPHTMTAQRDMVNTSISRVGDELVTSYAV
ncbi:MAG: FapA family protein [Oscillospiraceae bacterium]|jgi:uncharacterized protein (DUF342 family)|nr:FapA family protein [Oscillospiraceae bacterium]